MGHLLTLLAHIVFLLRAVHSRPDTAGGLQLRAVWAGQAGQGTARKADEHRARLGCAEAEHVAPGRRAVQANPRVDSGCRSLSANTVGRNA